MSVHHYNDPPSPTWFRWNLPGLSMEDADKASQAMYERWPEITTILTPPLTVEWCYDDDTPGGVVMIREEASGDDEDRSLTVNIHGLLGLDQPPEPTMRGRAGVTIQPRRRP